VKKLCSYCRRTVLRGYHTPQTIQTVQPFPNDGLLAKKLNLPLARLRARLGKAQERAYSYVVCTVKLSHSRLRFEQHGCAPNFQGDVLTLCTCKHQMRASQSADEWRKVWVAGFTSRTIYEGKHWLFYLARVESAHESHSDLWKDMDAVAREAKAAHVHYLGDMFRPTMPGLEGNARYSPRQYHAPTVHAHRTRRNPKGWHNDIRYHLADKYGYPSLLVADPHLTFLWDEPMIFLNQDHCRNYLKWSSLQEVLAQLGDAK
jgi:hypothetical protein